MYGAAEGLQMIRVIRVISFPPVIAAFLLGALVKGALIAVAETSANARLIGWLLVDPAVPVIATPLTAALFDPRRLVSGRQESLAFDVFLAAGFGLECALVALVGTVAVSLWRRR